MKIIEKKSNSTKYCLYPGAVFACGNNPRQYWMYHKVRQCSETTSVLHELVFLGYSSIGIFGTEYTRYIPGDMINVYEYILLQEYQPVNATLTIGLS